ncbi:unnamed protein product [Ixodes pacificus]
MQRLLVVSDPPSCLILVRASDHADHNNTTEKVSQNSQVLKKKRKKGPRKLIHRAVQFPASLNVYDEVREPEHENVASTAPSTSCPFKRASTARYGDAHASEIYEKEKKAEEKLKELLSTSATTQKAALMA